MRVLLAILIGLFLSACAEPISAVVCTPACDTSKTCVNGTCISGVARSCSATLPCQNGTTCIGGTCLCKSQNHSSSICLDADMCCQGSCINTASDANHCGQCQHKCYEDQICTQGQCVASSHCQDKQLKCANDERTVMVCMNDDWIASDTICTDDTVCKDGKCIAQPCQGNTKRCTDQGDVEQCINGTWQTQTCLKGMTCHAQTLTCKDINTCSGDAKKCNGHVLQVCQNGHWQNQPCGEKNTCYLGQCVPKCDNGTMRCHTLNGSIYTQRCQNNVFTNAIKCSDNQVCIVSSGTAGCFVKICQENHTKCENKMLFKCVDNNYIKIDKC